jgi:oxygen tolerance protein BatD
MNPRWMRHGLWLLLLSAFACATSHAVGVRAWLDRDTMQVGETVTLNVEADGVTSAQPDFSALKQDFSLLGTQSSQQVSIVNGASTTKTLWAIGLEPRSAGTITIAPISVGGATTAPLQLRVLPAAAGASSHSGDDVFIETTAEPLGPYVQQQVRYTVKLYYAFDLTDGNLTEPKADGIAVQRLGQDKSYVATVGARRYHVVERHYALTPERSGPLQVPAVQFRGSALDASDPTGFFSRGRNVSARGDAVQLAVKAKPDAWSGSPWLPAASLLLKDESELPSEVHVGDPVTRTIRLQAQGLGYEQLPELELAAADGAQAYPDKADTRTRDDGEWLYGERVRKFAFVPTRPGTLTIPGLSVRWWDTAHDHAEVAQLPPKAVRVLPAAGTAASPANPIPAAPAVTAPPVQPAATAATAEPLATTDARTRPWQLLAAVGFALWLATLALWWHSRRSAALKATPHEAAGAPDGSAARAAFLRACAMGELAGAERSLLAWARGGHPVRNLGELAALLDDEQQRAALDDLQRARYAGGPTRGLATRLRDAFGRGLAWHTPAQRTRDALPPLYPERD